MLVELALTGSLLYATAQAYQVYTNRKKRGSPKLVSCLMEGSNRQNPVDAPVIAIQEGLVEGSGSPVVSPVDRQLAISASALGLATVSQFGYPLLGALSVFPILWIVVPILRQAFQEFREKETISERLTMTTVDGVLILGTLSIGRFVAMSTDAFMRFVSQKLISKTEDQSKSSLLEVFGNQPRSVWIQHGEEEIEVSTETLQVGDVVIVNAGEVVPIDGVVIDGIASIDQHMLTGESQPADKGERDRVMASTIVLAGRISIAVEQAGENTVAAQIEHILNHTVDFKSSTQLRAEELGNRYAYLSLAMSALTLPMMGAVSAISILHANFGYDLRISGPLSILNFLRLASRHGILVKDGRALELLTQVDTVVFDKTGTLTLEQPHVDRLYLLNGLSEDELILHAAVAEHKQTHPIALAILAEARQRGLTLPSADDSGDTAYTMGYGIEVQSEGQYICVGSARFMQSKDIAIPSEIKPLIEEGYTQGHSYVYVAVDATLAGVIELHATIRPEAAEVIDQLRQRGLSLAIISGDHEQPTRNLAQMLGIERYFAETLPEEKAKLIAQLQQEGKSVCYVGDGINDAIALKQANVSISLSGSSAIATDTAQIILMDQSLNQLASLFAIADDLRRNMNRNVAIAVSSNIIVVSGIYLFHFGLVTAILLANASVFLSMMNAMSPMLQTKKGNQT
ncbi:MAG: heavy metal translocating P-type ATPase [Chloroflexota bacterium]